MKFFYSKLKRYTIILVAFVITGCSGLTEVKQLDYSASKINDHESLIFGTFSQKQEDNQRTGLWVEIENLDNKSTFVFPFKSKNYLSAVPLTPSTYRIKNFYFAKGGSFGPSTWTPRDYAKIPIPKKYKYLSKPFLVESNQAVYIGDYFGITRGGGTGFTGQIVRIVNNYNKAKREFNLKYKSLKNMDKKTAFK